jgi:AAA15 family ATPase/GTPase
VLIVDEIHNSLHPVALKQLISLFHRSNINDKNSQLVFTTHDTNAMTYLHRDQIWLLDKNTLGSTTLAALDEFEGRPDEAVEKRYLGGRYGAIPSIGSGF